jgi:serine/threonine-protein kinase RsbW
MRRLTVPAVIDSLSTVNDLVYALAAAARLSERRAYGLRLATEELFTNIVNHGYGPLTRDGQVVIEAEVRADRVELSLTDTAARFDPTAAPEPTGLDLPLTSRQPGSLGIFLARNYVDEVHHRYVDGANHTTIVLWLTGDGGGNA